LVLDTTTQFDRDVKRQEKRGKSLDKLHEIIEAETPSPHERAILVMSLFPSPERAISVMSLFPSPSPERAILVMSLFPSPFSLSDGSEKPS